jgi:VQ motif
MSNDLRKQLQANKQVKVTIIETQFVKTDEANFKSVVHQFTGKDSKTGAMPRTSPMGPQAPRPTVPIMAQSQMEVVNASSGTGSKTSRPQTSMVDREAAVMEDFESFLKDVYKFIDA